MTEPGDFLSFDKNTSGARLCDLCVPECRRSSIPARTGVTEEIRIAGLMLN